MIKLGDFCLSKVNLVLYFNLVDHALAILSLTGRGLAGSELKLIGQGCPITPSNFLHFTP